MQLKLGHDWIFFIAALVAMSIPCFFVLLSKGFRLFYHNQSKFENPKASVSSVYRESLQKINTRYFLCMNICFLLIAFVFLFIPGVISLQQRNDPELLMLALISTVFISVSISIVLMYSARKKDLDWIWSFKKDEHDGFLGK